MAWLQTNWEFIDLNWLILRKDDRDKILDTIWELPINGYIKEIQESVAQSTITIISAETGSWKTTQVPKMIMNMWNIVVVEPRVIAAIWAATRVSNELLTTTLDQQHSIWHNVWYQTWREVLFNESSNIIYWTDWYQLLNQFVGWKNPDVLIIDEVHVFSVATEFLIAQVKKLIYETNQNIKLILMSATIDTKLVSNFFSDIEKNIPILNIPWRTFPVEKKFMKTDDFIPSILEFAKDKKNILVFVEWKKQIQSVIKEISENLKDYDIFPLHSELPVEEQTKLLKYSWKPTIIIATNIAQESITIDYINAVVDNWYCKVLKVNKLGVPELFREPISKADCLQRAWRSWRVMPWNYVRANDIAFEELDDYPTWEIENTTLERYILISLSSWFDPLREIKTWEKIFIHNPDKHLLELTYKNLKKLWAIDENKQVTEIWSTLLTYPIAPKYWIILLNSIKRNCSWNIIDMVSIMNHNWFTSKVERWKDFIPNNKKEHSDLIALSELLKFISSTHPLNRNQLSKFKKHNINELELSVYQWISKIWIIIDRLLEKINSQWQKEINVFDLYELVKIKKLAKILDTKIKENPTISIKIEQEIKEIIKISWKLVIQIKNNKLSIIDDKFLKVIWSMKKEHKLFEIIDVSWLWIKTRRVYEILNTIETLKDRLDEQWLDVVHSDNIDDIIISLLTWLSDGIYIWDQKTSMFYDKKKWWFQLPKSSVIRNLGLKNYYIGSPFIIWSSNYDIIPLLFYITKVEDFHIKEALTENEKLFEWIKFTENSSNMKDEAIKYMKKDLNKVDLSNLVSEIISQWSIEDILSFYWLPDFLIENNKTIKKFIRINSKWEFNINIFKKIIAFFTPMLVWSFDINKIQKTLNDYIHDESVLEKLLESDDVRIKEFLENPYKKEYSFDLNNFDDNLSIKQQELLSELKKLKVRNIKSRGNNFHYMRNWDNLQEIEKIWKWTSEKKQKNLEKRLKKQEFYEKVRELKDQIRTKTINEEEFFLKIEQLETDYKMYVKNIEDIFVNIQIQNKTEEENKDWKTLSQFRYKKKVLRKLARLRRWDSETYNKKLKELYKEFWIQSLDEKREERTKRQLLTKLKKARNDIRKLLSQAWKENINAKSLDSRKKIILSLYWLTIEEYENYMKEEKDKKSLNAEVNKEIKKLLETKWKDNLSEEEIIRLKNQIRERYWLPPLLKKKKIIKEEVSVWPLKPKDKTWKLSRKRKKKLKN